jgi:hypothetical protein
MWITCPPILKSSNPWRTLLARCSLYQLNRIGDKQHSCLTPVPVFTLLVSPWSIRTLTLYLRTVCCCFLLCLSWPVLFKICINLVQFTQSNTFWQSYSKHSLSSESKVPYRSVTNWF